MKFLGLGISLLMLWLVLRGAIEFWRFGTLQLNWVDISWKDSRFFFLLALAVHLLFLWFAIHGLLLFFSRKQ